MSRKGRQKSHQIVWVYSSVCVVKVKIHVPSVCYICIFKFLPRPGVWLGAVGRTCLFKIREISSGVAWQTIVYTTEIFIAQIFS